MTICLASRSTCSRFIDASSACPSPSTPNASTKSPESSASRLNGCDRMLVTSPLNSSNDGLRRIGLLRLRTSARQPGSPRSRCRSAPCPARRESVTARCSRTHFDQSPYCSFNHVSTWLFFRSRTGLRALNHASLIRPMMRSFAFAAPVAPFSVSPVSVTPFSVGA